MWVCFVYIYLIDAVQMSLLFQNLIEKVGKIYFRFLKLECVLQGHLGIVVGIVKCRSVWTNIVVF